jgi:hypothetical protein
LKENEVLAVFETLEDSELETKPEAVSENTEWVTLHEIVNTKFVHNYLVHPFVSNWFLENPAMLYIIDKYENAVEIPYVLYLLQQKTNKSISSNNANPNPTKKNTNKKIKEEFIEGGAGAVETPQTSTFTSVLSSLTKVPEMITSSITTVTEEKSESESKSKSETPPKSKSNYIPIETSYAVLPPKTTYPGIGHIFLFGERGTKLARRVVFITKTLYLLDQPPNFSLFNTKNYDSIYFQEPGLFQSLARNFYNTNKTDLQFIYNPIQIACMTFLFSRCIAEKRN